MEKLNKYQKGAQTTKKILQDRSLKNYYDNPKICKNCGKIIEVKEGEKPRHVRKKTFCDSSCSATYNNKVRELKREKKVKPEREKKVKPEREKKVKPEKFSYLNGVTKKEFIDIKGIYYKFRAVVRKHAHFIYEKNNGNKFCSICGYDKHIQVCHIKSVSSFSEDSLITDINAKENLIGLCPNHHWEYDNGYIDL